jgi:hypothetical protein
VNNFHRDNYITYVSYNFSLLFNHINFKEEYSFYIDEDEHIMSVYEDILYVINPTKNKIRRIGYEGEFMIDKYPKLRQMLNKDTMITFEYDTYQQNILVPTQINFYNRYFDLIQSTSLIFESCKLNDITKDIKVSEKYIILFTESYYGTYFLTIYRLTTELSFK